jgi:hypothetical protein
MGTTSRKRTRVRGRIMTCVIATAIMTLTWTASASAAVPPSGRTAERVIAVAGATTSSGTDTAPRPWRSASALSRQSASSRYWTADRMRKATPVVPPRIPAGRHDTPAPRAFSAPAGTATGHRVRPAKPVIASRSRSSAQRAKAADTPAPDVAVVGEVFFHNPVATADVPIGDHFCTGSAMNSDSKELVSTAARCVHGGAGGDWYQNWIFIPGYRYFDGLQSEPYGAFAGRWFGAETDWVESSDPSADVAMVQTQPNYLGRLVDVVGGMGLEWSDPLPPSVTVVGYAWTCTGSSCLQEQAQCSASPQDGGQSMITAPCGYEADAAGSPWVTGFDGQLGDVNGTVSVLYDDGTNASPYYDDRVYDLYETIGDY